MENEVKISFEVVQALLKGIQDGMSSSNTNSVPDNYIDPFAAWLLAKSDYPIVDKSGKMLSKSEVEETTLDFTRTRSLDEATNAEMIKFIYDKSDMLRMFNSRTVNKLVVPIEGSTITKENLISNEQNGGAVTNVNRRIVHKFGIDLFLKNFNLQKNIPLQTVINNLYNPNFYQSTMNDVAIALANDLLLLATNGLEYASYASSENFYDLNKGFVRILQLADGDNTNTYGNIKVKGFSGKHLTPQKVNAVGCTGSNYTGANLITLMRKMYNAMLPQYRNNQNNVWMMSPADADLYMDSRSDMTSPSNVTREAVLTGGLIPNFKGHRIVVVPDMYSINETHKYQSSVPGAIIFGDPKNIDIAMSSNDIVTSTDYNARGSEGAVYEYDFHGYMDVQVSRPESFVIAFNGAKVSTPYFVTAAGAKTGNTGAIAPVSANTYNNAGENLEVVPYCDNEKAVILRHTSTLNADYATAVGAGATVVEQGVAITLTADTYMRAYHPNMTTSTEIWFDKAI